MILARSLEEEANEEAAAERISVKGFHGTSQCHCHWFCAARRDVRHNDDVGAAVPKRP